MTNITSLVCPDLGRWRAWLDNEAGTARFDQHLETCPACQNAVAELRADAANAGTAIAALNRPPATSEQDIATARERLAWRQRVPVAAAPRRWQSAGWAMRVAAGSMAAMFVIGSLLAFSPETRTAAAAFLAQFRGRQLVAVEVSPQSQEAISRTLNTLSHLGTISSPRAGVGQASPGQVTVAEASKLVGFPVQTPDPGSLPAGFDRTPRVRVVPASEMRFTFDKAKAQRYLQSNGQAPVNLPDKFNGATLIVSTPAAAMLEYANRNSSEMLMIGQAGELVIDVQGQVTLDELRDFLLGLPGLPPETVQQLKLIRNWRETIPVPVPTDKINWKPETFKGAPGLLLNDNSGVGSAAVWQSGGNLYGVAGSLKATELKRVADSLAVR